MEVKLFGLTLGKDKKKPGFGLTDKKARRSFVPPKTDDDSINIETLGGGFFGHYLDTDPTARSDNELIYKYREMSMHPECESAIEDVVGEAIVSEDNQTPVKILLDKIEYSGGIKKKIGAEFDNVMKLLEFQTKGYEIFRRWFIDGKIYYHIIVDEKAPKNGIAELRYIDAVNIQKIREFKKENGPAGSRIVTSVQEYYVYNKDGFKANAAQGLKISPDAVAYVNSGLFDARNKRSVSYLHKAIKPMNQLRMMEDAVVIYRLCLVGDTRVKTNNGWKYIKDIQPGDTVYSFNTDGLFETGIKNAWSNGVKDVYRVRSTHHEIVGTDNHPILVYSSETGEVSYVDIKDLDPEIHYFVYERPKSSDKPFVKFNYTSQVYRKLSNPEIFSELAWPEKEKAIKSLATNISVKKSTARNFLYGIQFVESTVAESILSHFGINDIAKFETKLAYGIRNPMNLPEYVDTDFAQLFGFLVGDGSISKSSITFAEGVDDKKNQKYADLLTKFFGNCTRINSKRRYSNWTAKTTEGVELLKSMGYCNGAKIKRIPEWIYRADDAIKTAFVVGLCEADGHIKTDLIKKTWNCSLSLSNKQLVEDVKELWTSLGFTSGHISYRKREAMTRIIGEETEPRTMPATEAWTVYLSTFALQHFEPIHSIEYHGQEEVFDIEVESDKHNFVANGVVVHNSRAPERRVFYVDVGSLPKNKAEQYVRDLMNRHRNKLVYDATTGEVRDDRRHLSMLEDYWMPRREGSQGTKIETLPGACLDMDTKVSLLDGRELSIRDIAKETSEGKELWAYSCHPTTGEVAPGIISWAGVTQESAKVMRVTFDNGTEVICTPDHKFPQYGVGFVRADELTVGSSMIPLYRQKKNISKNRKSDYEQYFDNASKTWTYTHRRVASYLKNTKVVNHTFDVLHESDIKNVVHHINFDRFDNSPINLCFMNWDDHQKLHAFYGFDAEDSARGTQASVDRLLEMKENEPQKYQEFCDSKSAFFRTFWQNCSPEYRDEISEKISVGVQSYCDNLSPKEKENRAKNGRLAVQIASEVHHGKLRSDEMYRKHFCDSIRNSWTLEHRSEASTRQTAVNYLMWKNPAKKISHKKKQKVEIDNTILTVIIDLVTGKTTHQTTIQDVVSALNSNETCRNRLVAINVDKSVPNWSVNDGFSATVLARAIKEHGYSSWSDLRKKHRYHNHRVTKIEYLDEPRQVGTLTIDNNEVYHNYHTFALSCGVFTKNSNLSNLEDVKYFQKKLYKSMNVPIGRLDGEQKSFTIGKSTEITRDEIKFAKFISRLRNKFAEIFYQLLRTQLILKGIIEEAEWDIIKDEIFFDFLKDSYFAELKNNEILNERVAVMAAVEPYIGRFYSEYWVQKNVLGMNDEDIAEEKELIATEKKTKLKETDEQNKEFEKRGMLPIDANGAPYDPLANMLQQKTTEKQIAELDNPPPEQPQVDEFGNPIEQDPNAVPPEGSGNPVPPQFKKKNKPRI